MPQYPQTASEALGMQGTRMIERLPLRKSMVTRVEELKRELAEYEELIGLLDKNPDLQRALELFTKSNRF